MSGATGFWKGKKVLVTGAAGFIGSHLVEHLLDEGAIVTGTSRKAHPEFLKDVEEKITLLVGDLDDPEFCAKACTGQDIVMNIAANVGGVEYNKTHQASIYIKNTRPFLNMLEAAHSAKVERFLVVSSACVYPRHCTIPTPEEEGFKEVPEPTNAGYGWAKRMQEFLAKEFSEEYGLPVAIARPYNAYGPRDNFDPASSHVIPGIIHRVEEGQDPLVVWGNGEQTRAFLYVEDFVRGLMLCAENGVGKGPINIGTDEEVKIKELVNIIIEVSDRNPKVTYDTTKPSGQPRRNCDTRKSKKELGFEAKVPLKEGLKRTIEWYRKAKND